MASHLDKGVLMSVRDIRFDANIVWYLGHKTERIPNFVVSNEWTKFRNFYSILLLNMNKWNTFTDFVFEMALLLNEIE